MISFQQVQAFRASQLVLANISCHCPTSSFTLLLGRSGSGKSTFLRLINRLTDFQSGEIQVANQNVRSLDLYLLRRQIGFVPQGLGLFPHRSVAQQLRLAGGPSLDIAAALSRVDLPSHYADRFPRQLSGGEQQRVAIARALAADPPYLLLDEAFSALDPLLRRDLISLVAKLARTTILASHDPATVLSVASQVLFLERGQLAFAGSVADYHASSHPLLRAYREASSC